MFKHYHYLTGSLPTNGECYVGFINQEPVAFVCFAKFPHPTNKNIYKISRVVVLPHWQGYGIGMKMVEHLADKFYQGRDLRFTTTLPIIHNYLWKRKDKWVLKFQGIRKGEEAGANAQMAKVVREVYLETYQYDNGTIKDRKVLRTGCPKEKIKQ